MDASTEILRRLDNLIAVGTAIRGNLTHTDGNLSSNLGLACCAPSIRFAARAEHLGVSHATNIHLYAEAVLMWDD